jgi:predicted PilT family ATPase
MWSILGIKTIFWTRMMGLQVTVLKPLNRRSTLPSQSYITEEEMFETEVFMEIEKKDIGRVIGKAGSTISKLKRDHQVAITVGKWMESLKEDRDSSTEKTQALLIPGRSNIVKTCHRAITEMLAADPQSKKKKILTTLSTSKGFELSHY